MDILKPFRWFAKTLSDNFNAPPHNGQPKKYPEKSTPHKAERLYEEINDRPRPRW